MPVRNAAKTLHATLLSMVHQTLTDWELILIDDGSTDDSLRIAQGIDDARLVIVSDGKALGLPRRLNQGIGIASGDFIARMDADDLSFPHRLERQLSFLHENPDVDLVGTRALTFDEALRPIGLFSDLTTHAELTAKVWRLIPICHPTWFARAPWLRQHPYATPEFWLAEDQELLLRTYRTCRFHCIDEVLFAYRLGSPPLLKLLRARRSLLRAFRQHHPITVYPAENALAYANFVTCFAADLMSNLSFIHAARKSRNAGEISQSTIDTFEQTLRSTGLASKQLSQDS